MTRKLRDDHGVAAVVGFVLILAAAITYYSHVARNDVPRWGAEGEKAWDAAVGESLLRLERAAGAGIGSDASVTESVPAAPQPKGLNVPFIQAARAQPPSGSVSFDPDCGGVTAAHDIAGVTITDMTRAGTGCIRFRAQATYTASYEYLLENGGLLRIQGDRAAVLAGPALELKAETGRDLASLTVVEMRGPATGVGASQSAVPIDLVPRPGSAEAMAASNAASASWTLRTAWPGAWAAWFAAQIGEAGLDADHNYACVQGDARAGCGGLAPDEMRVVLYGPNGPALPLVPDVTLSLSYGRYDVAMG